MAIKTVGVVGTGIIGASWIGLFLAHGLRVLVADPGPGAEKKLAQYLEKIWPTLQELGLSQEASLKNYEFVGPSLDERYADVDFVQENAPEKINLKIKLVSEIDAKTRPDVVIASSSSGIPSSEFITECKVNPGRVLIGHPFNPPHLMPLVEVVPHADTHPDCIEEALTFYRSVGKSPIHIKKEIPGFVANCLQAVVCNEAYSLITRRVVSAMDLDLCVTNSLGPRWAVTGPLVSNAMGGGGGADGFRHLMEHLGPASEKWLEDIRAHRFNSNKESIDLLTASVAEELEKEDVVALEARRDRLLIKLFRDQRQSDSACQRLAQKRPNVPNCDYVNKDEPGNSSVAAAEASVIVPGGGYMRAIALCATIGTPTVLNTALSRRNTNLGPEVPFWYTSPPGADQQLLQHLCNSHAKIEPILPSGLLVGIQQFMRYWLLAARFPYVGDCLKSLSASHLRTLTKSTAMACMEQKLRVRAIHGMIAELQEVQDQGKDAPEETLECLDVSSKLLAWYSATPYEQSLCYQGPWRNEYAGFLKGVYTSPPGVSGPQKAQDRTTTSSSHLQVIGDALGSFSKCNLDQELRLATRELLDFVYNLSRSLAKVPPESHDAHLKIIYPIRSWLRLVPCALDRLYAGDFMMHLFLAHYEILMLSVSFCLPLINLPLAIKGRKAGLERYHSLVKDIMDGRFLHDENVANLTLVYQACFQWMAAFDTLMQEAESADHSQTPSQPLSWEWRETAYVSQNPDETR
ncbi:3-hydroxyacyl dehyrogenase [Fusarium heterosporum]|uniref:3-hydroxyacyl dehyrogenase n=1 Tax=Fusarium heterosporum TaxID=42747 RepID=A0A8H5WNP1_FUSHE|nr:3-hydroxyacyl dehyrogenase [Fusarium heterosporum]